MQHPFLDKRVKVKGFLKNGVEGSFSGNLDNVIETPVGLIAIVARTPIYDATDITLNPSLFERKWTNV
jgi:hypothetical protein